MNIHWTAEEKEKFYNAVIFIAETQPGLSRDQLAKKAMEHFPPTRRRPFSGPLSEEVGRALNGVAPVKGKPKKAVPSHRQPGPAEITRPERETPEKVESDEEPNGSDPNHRFGYAKEHPLQKEAEGIASKQPHVLLAEEDGLPPPNPSDVVRDAIIDLGTDIVVGILSQPMVRESLKNLVAIAIGKQIQDQTASIQNVWPPEHVRRRAPKVLIAGLIGAQMEKVRDELGDKIDFRFWIAGESKDQLRALASNADEAYGMTGFIRHSHDAIMKDRAKEHYHRISGGPSALIRVLKEKFARETTTQ